MLRAAPIAFDSTVEDPIRWRTYAGGLLANPSLSVAEDFPPHLSGNQMEWWSMMAEERHRYQRCKLSGTS